MTQKARRRAWALAERLLPPAEVERARTFPFADLGYGYDAFGMERETALLAYGVMRLLHSHWFRVQSRGIHHVPEAGAALLVPNHAGVIPIDGAMLATDVFRNLASPRVVRTVVDFFAADMPLLNTFLVRAGQFFGHRKNVEDLVRRGELVCIFPEGAKGTGKNFREAYRLRRFNVGFIEVALRHGIPIVPVSIIGSEEQAPLLYDVAPLARLLGLPYFPVTPTFPHLGPLGLVPLPVKYHVTYDEPLRFHDHYPPAAAEDPEVVRMLADKVQVRVQELVDDGRSQRESVFGLLPAGGLARRRESHGHEAP